MRHKGFKGLTAIIALITALGVFYVAIAQKASVTPKSNLTLEALNEKLGALKSELEELKRQVKDLQTRVGKLEGKEPIEPPVESIIESRIDGDFEGWDGETIFKLENGQIWQQASFSYVYRYRYRPKVFIYKTIGGYKMSVESVDKSIYVKRLK